MTRLSWGMRVRTALRPDPPGARSGFFYDLPGEAFFPPLSRGNHLSPGPQTPHMTAGNDNHPCAVVKPLKTSETESKSGADSQELVFLQLAAAPFEHRTAALS